MARVTSDLMRLPIAGSPEAATAASKERDSAAFDDVSRGHPPASHSAATCQPQCRLSVPQPLPYPVINAQHVISALLSHLSLQQHTPQGDVAWFSEIKMPPHHLLAIITLTLCNMDGGTWEEKLGPL